MKVVTSYEIHPDAYVACTRLLESSTVVEKLLTKYRHRLEEYDDVEEMLSRRVTNYLLPIVNYSRDLEDKSILDLGCGSTGGSIDSTLSGGWEPWLCRALRELGAKPIGIDAGNLAAEEFEHYSLDLLQPRSLSFLPDHSIDIAVAFNLFNSPHLKIKNRKNRGTHHIGRLLYEHLTRQLERIVKPCGLFIYTSVGT